MKKNIFFLFTLLMASVVMSGCGEKIPDMSEEETALVTEYATNLLVKYSTVTDRKLLNEMQLEEEMAKEAEERERLLKTKELEAAYLQAAEKGEKITENKNDGSNTDGEQAAAVSPSKSIAEFFAEDSFSIDYTSYSLCDFYPEENSEDFFMAMDATAGHKLCVVKFSVKNISSSDKELDMFHKQGRFSLRTEDGSVISAQSTLLMDDLSSYIGNISANSEQEMVIVFEVPDSLSQMGSMELIMRDASGENTLRLE